MLSALLGSFIMSMATVSLLIAIDLTNKAIDQAGKTPLNDYEKKIILNAGYNNLDIKKLNEDLSFILK